MESIGANLMSALPMVSMLIFLGVIAFLAVRADGRKLGGPQSTASRVSRLEERVESLESRRT